MRKGSGPKLPLSSDPQLPLTDQRAGGMNQIDLPGGAVIKFPSDATIDQRRHLITAVLQVTSPPGAIVIAFSPTTGIFVYDTPTDMRK